jgi:hypothetical protein
MYKKCKKAYQSLLIRNFTIKSLYYGRYKSLSSQNMASRRGFKANKYQTKYKPSLWVRVGEGGKMNLKRVDKIMHYLVKTFWINYRRLKHGTWSK